MKLKELVEFSNGKLIGNADLETEISKFAIDSRLVDENTFFIPLKGENSDGHNYINSAFESGAIGTFTSQKIKNVEGKIIIQVEDTLKTLQNVAKKLREKLVNIPLVAITGSVGKTTTKDMIYSVLASKYKTLKTKGNFNNDIGLPLTLVNYKNEEMIVLEMGMNHFGEISFLSNIAMPNTSVIINVGHSHIGNLGSRENILEAKMEIIDGMNESGTLIINGDNDMLQTVNNVNQKLVKFGLEPDNDIVAYNIKIGASDTEFCIKENEKEYVVKINLSGEKFIYNALAAWTVGKIYDVAPENRVEALANCEFTKMRMNIEEKNGITLINDCYNASPESMKLAIETLAKQEAKRKIAILGDMFELGEYSEALHKEVGKSIAENKIDKLYTVGKFGKFIIDGAVENGMSKENTKKYENLDDLLKELGAIIVQGDAVLVKASRAMNFEKIVEKMYGICNFKML